VSGETAEGEPQRLVADAIVEQLVEWGVKQVYGIPGETSLQIVDAIRRRSDQIRFVLVRHEEVAAFMASAYAKLTGDLGVCLSIAGPGATNLVTGFTMQKWTALRCSPSPDKLGCSSWLGVVPRDRSACPL